MRIALCVAAAPLLAANPALARDVAWVDVPAGTLRTGITRLGAQTGSSIALADPALARLPVARTKGRMTAEQALRRMTRGLAVDVVVVGPSSFRLVATPRRRPRRPVTPPVAQPVASAPANRLPPPKADIVVTASKRKTDEAHYHGSVRIVGPHDVEHAEWRGSEAIVRAGTSLSSTHLGPGRDKLFLRGVGDSSFSGHTQATVGQYLGESRLNYSGRDPDLRLYDIGRTELLLGPQGTLYGAGSLGGIIRMEPNRPDPDRIAAEARLSASTVSGGAPGAEVAAMLNLPFGSSDGGTRIIAYRVREGGYIDDVARDAPHHNRRDISGARAAFAIRPADDWHAEILGVWQDIDGRDADYADHRLAPRTRAAPIAEPYSNRFGLLSATLRGERAGLDIVANLSRSHARLRDIFDASETVPGAIALVRRETSNVGSAEIRVSRDGEAAIGWLVGASVVDSRTRFFSALENRTEPTFATHTPVAMREYILFGEASHAIGPVTFSFGGRATRWRGRSRPAPDTNVGRPPSNWDDAGWTILPGASALLTMSGGIQLLIRYAASYRPPTPGAANGGFRTISGDRYAAWETAVRFPASDGRPLTGGLSLSFGRWRNVQADIIDHAGYLSSANIGDAKTLTAEANAQWRLSERLRLDGGVTVNRAIVAGRPGIDIVGRARLPNVPDVNARLAVLVISPDGAPRPYRISATLRHTGRSRLGIGPELGRWQGGFLDADLDASLDLGKAQLYLAVSNLMNSAGNRFALGSLAQPGSAALYVPQAPRRLSIGIRLGH